MLILRVMNVHTSLIWSISKLSGNSLRDERTYWKHLSFNLIFEHKLLGTCDARTINPYFNVDFHLVPFNTSEYLYFIST